MINEEPKTEQIDRYLDDEMMPAERTAFEERLRLEEELRLELEAQKAVKSYILLQEEKKELKSMFDSFHTDLSNEYTIPEAVINEAAKPAPVRKVNWGGISYLAIAASVALLIVSVWVIVKEVGPGKPGTEIRTGDEKSEKFRIPLLVWEQQNGARVRKETRFMDATLINDAAHHLNYRFTDHFELYLNRVSTSRPKINLEYDNDTKAYKVWIDGRPYPIRKTNVIVPLR